MTKISIVLCGKNDDYGGNFDERLMLTLKYNIRELKKRGVTTEIVFVEWNPIPGKPFLSQKLVKKFDNIRCFIVEGHTHDLLAGPYKYMTFLEFFAKNVGIRRARGEYILCTNADVFYGDEVLDIMASDLNIDTFYRTERDDIRFSDLLSLDEKGMKQAVFRTNPSPISPYTDAAGDFTLGSKQIFEKVQGYDENQRFVKIHKDTRILFTALYDESIKYELAGKMYHIDHEGSAVGTDGTLSNYRDTNGPYHWKYILNLPYKNRPFWGMTSDVADETVLEDNITIIDFKKDFDITEYQFDDDLYKINPGEDMRPYIKQFQKFSQEKLTIASRIQHR